MSIGVLNKQDKKDLSRYKHLYSETENRFWKKGIEYLQNGKKRPVPKLQQKAERIIQYLRNNGYTNSDITGMVDNEFTFEVVSRAYNGKARTITDGTAKLIVEKCGPRVPDTLITAN